MDCDHATIVKKLEEEVNALVVRGPFEKQLVKIRMNISRSVIFQSFLTNKFLKRMMSSIKTFCRTLVF